LLRFSLYKKARNSVVSLTRAAKRNYEKNMGLATQQHHSMPTTNRTSTFPVVTKFRPPPGLRLDVKHQRESSANINSYSSNSSIASSSSNANSPIRNMWSVPPPAISRSDFFRKNQQQQMNANSHFESQRPQDFTSIPYWDNADAERVFRPRVENIDNHNEFKHNWF